MPTLPTLPPVSGLIPSGPLFSGANRQPAPTPRFGGDSFDHRADEPADPQKRIRQLEADNIALAEQVRMLRDLVRCSTHDMRNALSNVLSGCALLERRSEVKDEKTRRFLDLISRNAGDLAEMMNDLSSCASPSLTSATVDLAELQGNWQDEFSQFIQHRYPEIAFNFIPDPQPGSMIMDVYKIRRVLLNLVKNACEAMREAGTPNPRLEFSLKREAERVVIEITDNGPGFDANTLENRLFQTAFTTKPCGHGIGLMNCKEFVELHGGALRASSTPGQGASFRIELPLAPPTPSK